MVGGLVSDDLMEWGNLQKGKQIIVTDTFGSSRPRGAHDGIDFGVGLNEPFYAMHAGEVIVSGRVPGLSDGGDGDMIVTKIKTNGEEYDLIYQEFGGGTEKVHKGDNVERGQLIGLGGNSAGSISTGYHVHMGMILHSRGYLSLSNLSWNTSVNVLDYLDLKNATGTFTLSDKFGAGGNTDNQSSGETNSTTNEPTILTELIENILFKDNYYGE